MKGSKKAYVMDVPINYSRKSAKAKIIRVEANTTLMFRQCLPHQGMPYLKENLRIFSYIDFKNVKRSENETYPVRLCKSQMLNRNDFKIAQVNPPQNPLHTNIQTTSNRTKKSKRLQI